MDYDVIIAGGGPAGLNAALYAARSGLSCLVLEKMFAGGQMSTTTTLENYIGFPGGVDAITLAMNMEQQAKDAGAEIKYEEIKELELSGDVKTITTAKGVLTAKAFIACMGAQPRTLGVPGEDAFRGRGVSYCATCDGALYKDKTVAVVGGGDTALEDALFLAKYCEKVYLIHRRETFRGVQALSEQVKSLDNVELILSSVVKEIKGTNAVETVTVSNVATEEETELPVNGVFVAVGTQPNTELLKGKLALTDGGYVETDEEMKTEIPGVFAAGDLRKKPLRQVITAAADGAVAAFSVLRYIESR
ncbi:MAG: thioredoxin-disulfide reductase [Clostridia bacterium]|nr:thioredoxin-disulfide reductase [Clostridia bacterium]